MTIKQLISTLLLTITSVHFAISQEVREIIIGYSDNLKITKEATSLICFGFEADHPNNQCTEKYIDSEQLWSALINNEIQLALMPEEILIANQRKKKKPIIILPIYQQYLILVGSKDLTLDSITSFKDRAIGVSDWITKEHRGKPIFNALGLKEQDIYFPTANTTEQLSKQFCSFALDGVMLTSTPSNALVRELTTSCDAYILSFTPKQIQQIIKSYPEFYPGIIPKDMYWRVATDINTLKSRVFLVMNPNENITKSFFNSLEHIEAELNLATIRTDITPKSILETYDINPVPLHPLGQTLIDQIRTRLHPADIKKKN